jgi:hypothetical protein
LTQSTDRAPSEWNSGAEEQAAAAARAAERRSTWQKLGVVVLAAGVTGAAVLALIVDNPAVEASIEGELPIESIELAGNVTSQPTLATLGGIELGWDPYGPGDGATVAGQTIWVETRLSKSDCKLLSQIGGACGDDQAPPLGGLESLQVEAVARRLYASLGSFSADRSKLEAHYETVREGPLTDWTMQSWTPSLTLHLSCAQPLGISVTGELKRLGSPKVTRSVTCLPNGTRYRLRVLDEGPAVTTVGFYRALRFHAAADSQQGTMTLEHGTKSVDGDGGPLQKSATVELTADTGSTVSSQVVSPVEDSTAELTLKSARASHAVIDGDEETPDELERLPGLLTGLLVTWGLFLLGAATGLTRKLRPWRRNHVQEE